MDVMRTIRSLVHCLGLTLMLSASACSMTVGEVHPRPNVIVGGAAGPFALDVGKEVADKQELDNVTVTDFRQTLRNGFRSAVGSRFTEKGGVRLSIEYAELQMENLGGIGRFLAIRYRARWLGPDNGVIAELAGVAQPRNPLETGPRHLEDVVEVMYESLVQGLEREPATPKRPAATDEQGPPSMREVFKK
jgi:hypothetical protein